MSLAKGSRRITLDIDLAADLTGFGSAARPTAAHHRLLRFYSSPLLLGPPPSPLLLEWLCHVFTDEEASLVAHLPPLGPRTAARVARRAGRPVAEVAHVLDRLATTKQVLLAWGEPRYYTLMPVVPGTFEMALLTTDPTTRNRWHRRFAELFEELWEGAFIRDYVRSTRGIVRYLPVGGVSKSLYAAWPSDHLEEVLAPYDEFAVGNCQCRMAMQLVGQGCGKPLENCVALGPVSRFFVERGLMKPVDRAEIYAIKREAEEHGAITWMMNEFGSRRGNISCSCCGCCCHGLRMVNSLNAPGAFSRPHFLPRRKADACDLCRKCVRLCPTDAWKIEGDRIRFDEIRCVGCGVCVVSCKHDALELVPVEDARRPDPDWLRFLLRALPDYTVNTARVFARRMLALPAPPLGSPPDPV